MLKIEPLEKSKHHRAAFDCGVVELNNYIKNIAAQHRSKNISATYVLVDDGNESEIIGYYSLTNSMLRTNELPPKFKKRYPDKVPIVLLGRLAVDLKFQNLGHAKDLLFDAMEKAIKGSDLIGGMGFFVDAKNEEVKSFYLRYEFIELPGNPMKLFLPMDTIRGLFD